MMIALIKLPFILVAMIGLQVTTTPPQPPPTTNEAAPSTRLELLLKQRTGPLLVKIICWFAAAAEAVVILATNRPTMRVSQGILSTLVLSGTAYNIRPTALFFLGAFLTGFGGYIRSRCYRSLGRLFTFEMSIRNEHRLITDGPYSIVRHPGYTGVLFTMAGIVCWHASSGSWARECGILHTKTGQGAALLFLGLVSTISTGLISRMSMEDEALKGRFGKQWDDWAMRVPYMLIPWVY